MPTTATADHATCSPWNCAARGTAPIGGPCKRPTMATPTPGTVADAAGLPCQAATADSYPLQARCAGCQADLVCADGTASWAHQGTGQTRCAADPEVWTVVRDATRWDRATRTWHRSQVIVAHGLSRAEADALLTAKPHQHDLSARPGR